MTDSVLIVAQELGVDAECIAPMIASEVEYRLRELIQDAGKFMKHSKREFLMTKDVDLALKLHGHEGLHGFGCSDPMTFSYAKLGNQQVYFLKQPDVDLNELSEDRNLPKAPTTSTFSIHWLAVDGVQPSIVENPTTSMRRKAASSLDDNVRKRPKSIVKDGVEIKPPAIHVLSQELQLYFDKVIGIVKLASVNEAAAEAVYSSLSTDPGLNQLLPYLTKFISELVMTNMRNLPLLLSAMRLTEALLLNPTLQLELYLHQLMPAILSCLVGKRLCASPYENHWLVRNLAAKLISFVCFKYGNDYPDIQPRISKTLHVALLDKKRPLTTHYGAIVGIVALGYLAVEKLLIPTVSGYLSKLELVINSKNQNTIKCLEAEHCFSALQLAFTLYIKNVNLEDLTNEKAVNLINAINIFGERCHLPLSRKFHRIIDACQRRLHDKQTVADYKTIKLKKDKQVKSLNRKFQYGACSIGHSFI